VFSDNSFAARIDTLPPSDLHELATDMAHIVNGNGEMAPAAQGPVFHLEVPA
jgi:hypothetical protein